MPAVSASSLLGKGVFTTAAVLRGEAFRLENHLARLSRDANAVGIDAGGNLLSRIPDAVAALVRANGVTKGKMRITLLETAPPESWAADPESRTRVGIQTADLPVRPEALRLGLSEFRVNSMSPLAGVKSCNYLEPLIASGEARRAGLDEALRLNQDGAVVSACLANVFWRSRDDGRWRTPPASTGCLPGTTREAVMEQIDVLEAVSEIEELRSEADAMFITSAVVGIAPVLFLDGGAPLGTPEADVLNLLSEYHS